MYVIDVIPLSRTAPGVLSYRSAKPLPVGTLVHITVRKTKTQGIVIGSVPVAEAKSMLKSAHFLLSKSALAAAGALPEAIMRAATQSARYHATSVGAALAALFSEYVRAGVPLPDAPLSPGAGFAVKTIELPLRERALAYATRIQEAAAHGTATLLVVPTLPEAQFWKRELKVFSPILLSGAVAGAKRAEALEKAQTATGLVITTPSFSWTPVRELGAIIIDRPSAGTYTLPKRPYLSIPYTLRALAEARSVPLVLGDFPLSLEVSPEHAAIRDAAVPVEVVDVRTPKDEDAAGPWQALPEPVRERMRSELAEGGRALLLAARRGYAPAVVCRDCGQAQADERGMPLSFTTAGGVRRFVTSDGRAEADARRPCTRCGSWNLLPLGVGIERVEEEVRAAFPDAPCIVFSPEVARSPKQAKDALAQFDAPGSILIGTEAMFPWLAAHQGANARLPLGIVASADSLLALPFWRARERFVRLCYTLAGASSRVLLLTRHPEDAAVDAAVNPASARFWDEERALRRALRYPPFGTIVTLALEGTPRALDPLTASLEAALATYAPARLEDKPLGERTVRRAFVLTLSADAWPDEALSARLASLPPAVRIRIDPESIW